MAGFIRLEVEKLPMQAINQKIGSEVFEEFQKKCKQRNLQMCTVIEVFCRQYSEGRYHLDTDNILKWKEYDGKTSVLNTPINKEVYTKFKGVVKANGFFVKNVLSAFIEDYANKDLVMEFVKTDE